MKTGTHYRIAAVITAAGSSSRMGGTQLDEADLGVDDESDGKRQETFLKKEYRVLPGAFDADGNALTVLGAVTGVFLSAARISTVVITVPAGCENAEQAAKAALPGAFLKGGGGASKSPALLFVPGGASRRLSVYEALNALSGSGIDFVLIHDGARPWLSAALVNRVIDAAITHGAAIPVLPSTETPKIILNNNHGGLNGARGGLCGFIDKHPNREMVFFAQTPQGFAFEPLWDAHKRAQTYTAENRCREWTDDAEIWHFSYPERKIAAVHGEQANKKITFAEDLT